MSVRTKGTQEDPINIKDDDQQQISLQTKLQIARNKQLIQQAKLSGRPLDLCFAVIKTTICGQMKLKQRKLNKQIIDYYQKNVQLNISCHHFYPMLQPDYSSAQTKPNPCQLILYGVDFLSTLAIKNRFKKLETNIQQIYWINDSTCKIKYASKQQTDKIIKDQTNQIKIQDDNLELPKGWFQVKPYNIYSFQRKLYIRYATNQQINIPKQTQIKYHKFQKAQGDLAKYLMKQFKAEDKYWAIVHQIQRDAHLIRRHRHSVSRNRQRSRDQMDERDRGDRYRYRNREGQQNQNQNEQNRFYRRNRYDDEDQYPRNNRRPREHQEYNRHNNRNRSYRRDKDGLQKVLIPQIHKQVYGHLPQKMLNSQKKYNNNRGYDRQKVHFDACQVDSNYSFNNFGSLRYANQHNDLDLQFDHDRSDYDFTQMPIKSNNQIGKKEQSIDNLSFNYNHQQNLLQQTQNQQQKDSYDYNLNESIIQKKNNKEASEGYDFFDIKDSISEVQFNLVKQVKQNKQQNQKAKQLNDSLDFDSY